jgi:hypothetical protein
MFNAIFSRSTAMILQTNTQLLMGTNICYSMGVLSDGADGRAWVTLEQAENI